MTMDNKEYEILKRCLDFFIALYVLIFFSPLWVLIYCLVRLTSSGPGLYLQRGVIGKGECEFIVYKFRTMFYNTDDTLHKHAIKRFVNGKALSVFSQKGKKKVVYKLINDPRITPFGQFLRKTGLDEVPQFFNVLRGEMSVVGPRPPLYYEYEHYTEYHKKRLTVLPGITGLYQVRGRSYVPFDEMVELDLQYIQRRSFCLDLAIIAVTPWVMLTGKGGH